MHWGRRCSEERGKGRKREREGERERVKEIDR